jgi:hypothetical protein
MQYLVLYEDHNKNINIKFLEDLQQNKYGNIISYVCIKNKCHLDLFVQRFKKEKNVGKNNLYDVWYELSTKYVY